MRIRLAQLGDTQEIVKLMARLSHSPELTFEKRRSTFDVRQGSIETYVMLDGAHVIGTGSIVYEKKFSHDGAYEARISDVVIDEKYSGQGHGTTLVEFLIQQANAACYKVTLVCKPELINFYRLCGMRESGNVEMEVRF